MESAPCGTAAGWAGRGQRGAWGDVCSIPAGALEEGQPLFKWIFFSEAPRALLPASCRTLVVLATCPQRGLVFQAPSLLWMRKAILLSSVGLKCPPQVWVCFCPKPLLWKAHGARLGSWTPALLRSLRPLPGRGGEVLEEALGGSRLSEVPPFCSCSLASGVFSPLTEDASLLPVPTGSSWPRDGKGTLCAPHRQGIRHPP